MAQARMNARFWRLQRAWERAITRYVSIAKDHREIWGSDTFIHLHDLWYNKSRQIYDQMDKYYPGHESLVRQAYIEREQVGK